MSDPNDPHGGEQGDPHRNQPGHPGDPAYENAILDGREPEEEAPVPEPEGPTEVIETDYEIGQDNLSHTLTLEFDVHKPVFTISALAVIGVTLAALIFQAQLDPFFSAMQGWLTGNLAWFFIISGNIFVLLCLGLILSPLGSVRLGGPEATPDFTLTGWFAMLFAAGMGIGLMFYGVSEPMSHFDSSFAGVTIGEDGLRTDWAPLGGAEGDELGARRLGMAATIYHWGLHPWAIYAVVALALALFSFNKGLPLTMRSVFYPLLGDRIWGWPGHIIDIMAVFATIFGLATSLGFGAQQATAGLEFLFGIPATNMSMVILIIVITAIAMFSVIAGVDKGVKRLSEVNMGLAFLLLLFVLIVGPTMTILTGFFANLKAYAQEIIPLSNPFGRTDDNYRHGWTAFYWAWWISWSPFVGMFIARVSRGRTVRQFLIAVLLVPAIISVLWMTTFGGTAISMTLGGFTGISDAALELKLFQMLSQLPMTGITSFVGIVLVIVFFITSSDSGSLVIDTIAAGGKVNSPTPQRVFWCTIEGLVAIALLLAGGLSALQAMAVSTGFPFTIILLGACWAIVQGLRAERREMN
ncbi:BCCT family transporter [Paracoccus aerodenitrificans]|uniref:BCCT family transporter n=1 Tax=Paracoccus aerodenitrificans TaxID=3017781 RepID=UPI0022F0F094|nr:BCCT family transporter [Paracoccus aerodenitrificans]WBU64396.1 BCCT family transporter [Paracoccus aerodenitrificans]